jgi:LysR family transcriptional regulator, hydrogen peroxide-inducible genes activator
MITLRQLRYLDALARHRHFGRAADACAVSQPALSMQIKDMEQHLGAVLVERRAGEVVLTETGRVVAQRGERILSEVSDLEDFARHRGGVLSGRLRFGVIPSVAPYVLPRLLPVLQDRYPELELELRETQTRFLVEELLRGTLDVVMIAMPAPAADIETLALFEDAFLLAAPSADDLPNRTRITADDIDQSRLILLEEGHCLRDQALAFCNDASGGTLRELGATSLTTVMQMVANGYGVTLIPEVAVTVEARDERVKLLRFAKPEPYRTIGLGWRKTSSRARDFEALGKIVAGVVG